MFFDKIPPLATHIIAIRHAETTRNAQGKEIQGWIDDKDAQLNEKGKNQADELGSLLAKRYQGKVSTIYTSPLGRCVETADRISKKFGTLSIIKDPDLREICHGQHDTMPFQERNEFCLNRYKKMEQDHKEKFPHQPIDRFYKWKFNPLSERVIPLERKDKPLEGELETIMQLLERATGAFDRIGKAHKGETILVSTHAALIRTKVDEVETNESHETTPLSVYYESKSSSRFLPGNCVAYHFAWENGKLTFLGSEDLLQKK